MNSDKFIVFLVFLGILTIYLCNAYSDFAVDLKKNDYRRIATSADIVANTFLPVTLYYNKSFAFNGISEYIKRFDDSSQTPYYFIKSGQLYFSSYPVFTGLVATPFYLIPLVLNKIPDLKYYENVLKVFLLGRIVASFLTALSAVFMYYILRKRTEKKWLVIMFTVFYSLGTNSWSISSRGLWQHTVAQLFIAILIFTLLQAEKNSKLYWVVGLVSGFAFLARPTNIIISALVGLYILLYKKEHVIKYLTGLFPSFLFMGLYNYFVFGSALSQGYSARDDIKWTTPFSTSIPGILFSPARSFLFISPPLTLAYATILKLIKRTTTAYEKILKFLGIGFIFLLLVYCKWWAWEGADGFGYRMLTDFIPIVTVLSFEIVSKLKKFQILGIAILIVYSIIVQYNAVFNLKSRCDGTNNWNTQCLPIHKLLNTP